MSRLALWAHSRLPEWAVATLKAGRALTSKKNESQLNLKNAFFDLNGQSNSSEITLREGIRLKVHPDAFESFQWFCWKSGEMCKEYDKFIEICRGRKHFIDVGSCHGVYALTFAAMNIGCKVLAVEPSPKAREVLVDNIERNSFTSIIDVIPSAIGLDQVEREFHENWHHLEGSTGSGEGVKITTRSLDVLTTQLDFDVDCLKIDVEGHELFALKGASRILARRPPLFLEIHPLLTRKNGYDHGLCFDELKKHHYVVFEVGGRAIDKENFAARHHTFFTLCL